MQLELKTTDALLNRTWSSASLLEYFQTTDNNIYIINQAYLMNSSAEDLMDFKSAKSNLRKIASFPVCSFNSVMADFAFSSLRTAMYTFALCASNACMFYNVRVMDLLALTRTCLCRFFSNPYTKVEYSLSVFIYD